MDKKEMHTRQYIAQDFFVSKTTISPFNKTATKENKKNTKMLINIVQDRITSTYKNKGTAISDSS